MELYELTLVVNELQEKAIRDVFEHHRWKFIIAGLKKCEMPRLLLPSQASGPEMSEYEDDVDEEDSSSDVAMGHLDSNSKECSSGKRTLAGHCEENDRAHVDAFPKPCDLLRTEGRYADAMETIHGQTIANKIATEESEKPCQSKDEQLGRLLSENRKCSTQFVPVLQSLNSALPPEENRITTNQATLGIDVATRNSNAIHNIPKGFNCGNCSESFATFRELRFHLQQHKLAIEDVPRRAQAGLTRVATTRHQRNRKLCCRIELQNAYEASKRGRLSLKQNETKKVRGNTIISVEAGKSPRKRGRPRKAKPESPATRSERRVDVLKCFDCGNCSESFGSFSELRLHLQVHKEAIEGSRQFKVNRTCAGVNIDHNLRCETCDKTFPNVSTLRLHDRVHTGERPYLCNECGKAFKQPTAFQNHLRTHTGEKPFKCTMCEAAFRQLCELQRHRRRHTGEKPQLCTICGKRFAEIGYLKSHMRLHTGEKPFSCSICKKSFSQRTSLKCHMKSHHKNNCGEVGLQTLLIEREWTRNIGKTQKESSETEEGEIQPETSPSFRGDTRKNGHNESTTNIAERNHEHFTTPHHLQFISMKSPCSKRPEHLQNYNSTSALLQPQFVHMDPIANSQPLMHFNGDMYTPGIFQGT